MNVALLQLDGKIPNIALMRISAHHKALGHAVQLTVTGNTDSVSKAVSGADQVYGSLIFERSKPLGVFLKTLKPSAILGGTGWDVSGSLESIGITTTEQDYSAYPTYRHSIGFSQRGCRLRCGFCVVPKKEGAVKSERSINQIWRGEGHPREVVLLDNDFFGQAGWRDRIREIRDGGFKVSFNQGINARMITDEVAEAVGSLNYRDDQFKVKRLYTAWDNQKDEDRLFSGLNSLIRYGVKPDHIMVFMLIGYWPDETESDRLYRHDKLRAFGCRPYPMPYVRNKELVGFQRWCIGAYDKRFGWERWKAANYRPENL